MANVDVYNVEGKKVGTKELPDAIFGIPVRPELVEQAIVAQRANARTAIAHTKTRAEVRGGGKKPWRQKGTGRARHGSSRSPIWRGGGITFGPRNTRNFSQKMNKKARQKALFMSLSDKTASGKLIVLDKLALERPKTKLFVTMLGKLPVGATVLLVLPAKDDALIRSSRNVPGVTAIRGDSLNVLDVVRHASLLIPEQAIPVIERTYTTLRKD